MNPHSKCLLSPNYVLFTIMVISIKEYWTSSLMTFQKVINDYLIDLSFSRTIAEMSDRINLPRNIVDRANNMFKVTVVTITIITMGKA